VLRVSALSFVQEASSSVVEEVRLCVNTLRSRRGLAASRAGEGAPVVLVHGWLGSSSQLLSWLDCIDPARPVYFFDYSSIIPDIDSAVAELSETLLQVSKKHDRLVMGAGHSLGGVLLAKAAQRETVSGYLTVCSPVRVLRDPPATLELNVSGRYDFVVPASLAVRRGEKAYAQSNSGHLSAIAHTSTLSALRFLDEQTS
jgi:pimeloyl-ACP methyl ester carboxylesterase